MPLWSVTFAFLALPAMLAAATSANHIGFQGNTAFLGVQNEKSKSVVATTHAKTEDDEAQGAHSGFLMGIVGLYMPNLLGFLRMVEYMPHKQGLFFGLFLALMIMAVYTGVTAWNKAFLEEEDENSAEDITEKFEELVEKGELDFYTCMALSLGHDKNWSGLSRFVPKLIIVLSLQLVLPVMLMTYQTTKGVGFPTEQNHTYRIIGTMLFAFSTWNLHQGMDDECRTAVANMMFERHVSGWYAWPILFGELMSTLVALMMTVILFLIFADCTRPQDLLINCIAINFIVEVDNNLVNDHDSTLATKQFGEFLGAWNVSPSLHDVANRNTCGENLTTPTQMAAGAAWVQYALLQTNEAMRFLVPILAGTFTFLFAFANNESVCNYTRNLEPFPFCHGQLQA